MFLNCFLSDDDVITEESLNMESNTIIKSKQFD